MKTAREQAERQYSEGLNILQRAKTPNELDGATLAFAQAAETAQDGRQAIAKATGGSNLAFAVDPSTGADLDDPRIYQPVKNVCYFCSRPGKGDLTPVTVNVDGKRQTVLACPDDLAVIKSGREPELRGVQQGSQFVPWYGVRGYDPYTMYGSGNFLWDVMLLSSFSNMFGPRYYGGWGGYGSSLGGDVWGPAPDSGSGGGSWGGDWGSFDAGSGGGDWGGGGFGGGDWGGGGGGGGDW